MTDLVLHIGLPKTGTTTLQHTLSASFAGYAGKLKGKSLHRDPAKTFSRIIASNDHDWIKQLEDWKNNTLENHNLIYKAAKTVLISDESLTRGLQGNTSTHWPLGSSREASSAQNPSEHLSSCLKKLRDDVWRHGRVRTILVVRNQADWLASLYAQQSRTIKGAGKRDFNNRIHEMMCRRDDFVDWSLWAQNLSSALGEDNVCVLLLEDMTFPYFWEQLAFFLEGTASSYLSLMDSSKHQKKIGSIGNEKWRLRRYGGTTEK